MFEKSKALQLSPERNKNCPHNSVELLLDPIVEGEPGYDEVFITGKVSKESLHVWNITVDESCPTVVLNEKSRENLGLDNSPLVNELRRSESIEKSLISGGSWIWIEDHKGNQYLPLLRRDAEAPSEPNCLTGPAGRCGELLSKTSLDETNQEFICFSFGENENAKEKVLAFYDEESNKDEVINQKIKQLLEMSEILNKKYSETGDDKFKEQFDKLQKYKTADDIELIKIDSVENYGQELDTINTIIDGKVVDSVRGLAYMDKANNSLEVRSVLKIKLPENAELFEVMDGERFLRNTSIVKKENLKDLLENEDLVPALRNYIVRLSATSDIGEISLKVAS